MPIIDSIVWLDAFSSRKHLIDDSEDHGHDDQDGRGLEDSVDPNPSRL